MEAEKIRLTLINALKIIIAAANIGILHSEKSFYKHLIDETNKAISKLESMENSSKQEIIDVFKDYTDSISPKQVSFASGGHISGTVLSFCDSDEYVINKNIKLLTK